MSEQKEKLKENENTQDGASSVAGVPKSKKKKSNKQKKTIRFKKNHYFS